MSNCTLQWWDTENKEPHLSVFNTLESLEEQTRARSRMFLLFCRLYNQAYADSNYVDIARYNLQWFADPMLNPKDTINGLQPVVDTSVSLVAAMTPRQELLAINGTYLDKLKAKKATQYVDGVMATNNIRYRALPVLTDAAICGTGFFYIYFDADLGRVCIEKVFPTEVVVDETGPALFGEDPSVIYRVKYIDLDTLLARYGSDAKTRKIIEESAEDALPTSSGLTTSGLFRFSKVVRCVAAWKRRCDGEYGEPGRHVLAVRKGTLVDQEWHHDFLPIVPLYWSKRPIGYYGQGLIEQVAPLQKQFSEIYAKVLEHYRMMAQSYIFVQASTVDEKQLTNTAGSVVTYNGQPPMVSTPPSMPPDMISNMWAVYHQIFENSGVSQLAAFGASPSDRTPFRARQLDLEVEARRFILQGRHWEEAHRQLFTASLELAREYYKDNPSALVRYESGQFVRTVPWADINLDRDAATVRSYTTNYQATTPAGRMAQIEQMINIGVIDPNDARSLLDFPDISAYFSRQNAQVDLVDRQIVDMIEYQKPHMPLRGQDLAMAANRVTSAILRALADGAEEDDVILAQNYANECNRLLDEAAAQQAAAAQPPPPPPVGV